MGLPLRNPSGPSSLSFEAGSLSDSDLDLNSPDPAYHIHRPSYPVHFPQSQKTCHSPGPKHPRSEQCKHPHPTQQRKRRLRHEHTHSRPHAKPRHGPWAAEDLNEECALARSSVPLPGEVIWADEQRQPAERKNLRSRSSSSSGRSRPPSLERQDAFRDEKTAKRRRCAPPGRSALRSDGSQQDLVRMRRREQAEVEELYRMGLLYDDEHERGEGFSLESIVREEPVYTVRVRPVRRGRRLGVRTARVALSVDLALSALGEDEAFAGWLASGSSEGVSATAVHARETVHDTRLTVIYELADDSGSVVSEDDFLDDLDGWADYSLGEDGEETCNGNAAASVDDDVDAWVVLGHDGS